MTWHHDPATGYHRQHRGTIASLCLYRRRWVLRIGLLHWRAPREMQAAEAMQWAEERLGRLG